MSDDRPVQCGICNVYTNPRKMIIDNESKVRYCFICGKVALEVLELQTKYDHLQSSKSNFNSKAKTITCQICGNEFIECIAQTEKICQDCTRDKANMLKQLHRIKKYSEIKQ